MDQRTSVEMTVNDDNTTKTPETHPFLADRFKGILKEQQKPLTSLPKEWLKALQPIPKYPLFVKGDIDGFIVLFTNNLATLLAIILSAQPILGNDIVYGRMVPG